jgi:hypothetical protein
MSQPQHSPQKTGAASEESHATVDCPAVLQNDFRQGFSYWFSGSKILARERSPFQEIVIIQTARFGKILNIDGYNNPRRGGRPHLRRDDRARADMRPPQPREDPAA